MNLEPRKLDLTFLNLAPQGLKSAVFSVVNELVAAIQEQNVLINELCKDVIELKSKDKPISAARAKRGG